MSNSLSWGIISTGRIAKTFAQGLQKSKLGKLVAVASREKEKAEKFGAEFGLEKGACHGSYEALLADPKVQAVYIATPHPQHAEWAIKCAEAKKHILCEKPITVNYYEAVAVAEAAQANDVFLMEAFMYRTHPYVKELVKLIKEKVIGDVRFIQATFGFNGGYNNIEGRLLNNDLGGGGILDVGCYAASFARLVAGAALGKDFADPIDVKATGHLHEKTATDTVATASFKFEGGIVAQIATAVAANLENSCRIYGSEGQIHVPNPWFGGTEFFVHKNGEKEPRKITLEQPASLYANEADVAAENIAKREAAPPSLTVNDTLGNMKTLDSWRAQIGLVYNQEKWDNPWNKLTVKREILKVGAKHNMKYAKIEGVEIPISRLFLGNDNQQNITHASVIFDYFIEKGGNAFDTAWVYSSPTRGEALLGQWLKNRGIRKQVVILGKGAHTPHCNPAAIKSQLKESLDRLQTDYVDIYMMHRDNPEIPVSEFIDVLNELKKEGKIKAFGGSNWALKRVQEANEYAKSKGKTGFAAVSNNFSLAQMVEAPWGGCISSSDKASRDWFVKNQIPLLPWSSQAQGFFVMGDRNNDSFTWKKCWYSEDNFKRLDRCRELAKKKGCIPTNLAMAYVLQQSFPTFALFGPRLPGEIRTSLPALDVQLTPEEVKWLNLEA